MKTILNFVFLILIVSNTFSQQTDRIKSEDLKSAYDIQDSVMIKTRDGAFISAIIVRKKKLLFQNQYYFNLRFMLEIKVETLNL